MSILTILLVISVIVNIVLAWGFWNSAQLNQQYEDVITEMKLQLDETYDRLKRVDADGAFEADDEVGFVFSYIFNMIRELNQTFNPEKEYEEQEQEKQKEKKGLERFG